MSGRAGRAPRAPRPGARIRDTRLCGQGEAGVPFRGRRARTVASAGRATLAVPAGALALAALALAALTLAALPLAATGCRESGPGRDSEARGRETMTKRPVAEVIAAHDDSLLAVPGVIGVYEGARDDGTPVIRVLATGLSGGARARIPATLEGYPVEIEWSDEIRPLGEG